MMQKSTQPNLARGKRIKQIRTDELGMRSQEKFAESLSSIVGPITRGAVGNWERGLDISLENLTAICQLAEVSLDWLAYGKGHMRPNQQDAGHPGIDTVVTGTTLKGSMRDALKQTILRDVPLRGTAAASLRSGDFLLQTESGFVPRPPALVGAPGIYALRVCGKSMAPRYLDGELVFIDPHRAMQIGDPVIVRARNAEHQPEEASIGLLIEIKPDQVTIRKLATGASVAIRGILSLTCHKALTTNELFGI